MCQSSGFTNRCLCILSMQGGRALPPRPLSNWTFFLTYCGEMDAGFTNWYPLQFHVFSLRAQFYPRCKGRAEGEQGGIFGEIDFSFPIAAHCSSSHHGDEFYLKMNHVTEKKNSAVASIVSYFWSSLFFELFFGMMQILQQLLGMFVMHYANWENVPPVWTTIFVG